MNLGHNSSAVLITDGAEVIRLEEEKLVQEKGFYGFPKQSLELILREIDPNHETQVVIGHKSVSELFNCHRILIKFCGRESYFEYLFFVFDLLKFIYPNSSILRITTRIHLKFNLRQKSQIFKTVEFCDHHEAHAFSAIYDSGYNECSVLTLDGKGDFFSGKLFDYENGKLVTINSKPETASYGLVYSAATKALGFKMLRHEGKLTGLAAFGDPNKFGQEISERYTALSLNPPLKSYKKFKWREFFANRFLDSELDKYTKLIDSWVIHFKELLRNGAKKEDIAAGVQVFLENQVLADIKLFQSQNLLKAKLAIAGGVFANVKLNQRIWETGLFTDLFVQPAMDDAGTGLGAAASTLTEINRHENLDNIVYLGKKQNSSQIDEIIRNSRTIVVPADNLASECAKLLNKGSILGVYNGRTEWGPRALGNRSIIASAFLEEIPGLLNKRLKRNDFMPFAPIIRDIDADKVFENYSNKLKASKFMTVTLNVRDEFKEKIPSVVHLDGTARPQVLSRKDNPGIYDILDGIALEHGIGIALNTSFNMHELPILDSVEVALHNLSIGAVDYLLVNDRHLLKAQDS